MEVGVVKHTHKVTWFYYPHFYLFTYLCLADLVFLALALSCIILITYQCLLFWVVYPDISAGSDTSGLVERNSMNVKCLPKALYVRPSVCVALYLFSALWECGA